MLIPPDYVDKVLQILQNAMNEKKQNFTDTIASAALMGIHLNDHMFEMSSDLSKATSDNASVKSTPASPHVSIIGRVQSYDETKTSRLK
jgi:hypothetical protein